MQKYMHSQPKIGIHQKSVSDGLPPACQRNNANTFSFLYTEPFSAFSGHKQELPLKIDLGSTNASKGLFLKITDKKKLFAGHFFFRFFFPEDRNRFGKTDGPNPSG